MQYCINVKYYIVTFNLSHNIFLDIFSSYCCAIIFIFVVFINLYLLADEEDSVSTTEYFAEYRTHYGRLRFDISRRLWLGFSACGGSDSLVGSYSSFVWCLIVGSFSGLICSTFGDYCILSDSEFVLVVQNARRFRIASPPPPPTHGSAPFVCSRGRNSGNAKVDSQAHHV